MDDDGRKVLIELVEMVWSGKIDIHMVEMEWYLLGRDGKRWFSHIFFLLFTFLILLFLFFLLFFPSFFLSSFILLFHIFFTFSSSLLSSFSIL